MPCLSLPFRLLLLAAALIALAGGLPPSDLPDGEPATPARTVAFSLITLIDARNEPGPDALAALLAPEFLAGAPLEHHLQAVRTIRQRSGGLVLEGFEDESDFATRALVRTRNTEELLGLSVEVAATEPHLLVGVGLEPVKEERAAGTADAGDPVADLEAYLDRLAARDIFSGTVLVARGDELLMVSSRGPARRDREAPCARSTRFNVGSMYKMFTAVAVMQLVQEGRLALDDRAASRLPDLAAPAGFAEVTVLQLLTHTSGLGDYLELWHDLPAAQRPHDLDDMLATALAAPLLFAPGAERRYSNTGFLVLGALIESVTGRDYHAHATENVFAPAGMDATGCPDLAADESDLARGYFREDGPDGPVWRDNLLLHPPRGGPAGGGVSTVDDLWAFARALFAGELLEEDLLRQVLAPRPELGAPRYGLGFAVDPEREIVGHGGGFPGLSANLDVHLLSGTVAVVLANTSDGAQPVAGRIRELFMAPAD